MKNKLVSIIVPCYNQGEYLPECLDSVLAQTYANWECIIINDGSIDNTDAIAKEYCKKDSRYKYLYQENQGVITARNNAILYSRGDYILPLDGDDKIDKTFLMKTVKKLNDNDNVKVVYCHAERFDALTGTLFCPKYSMQRLLAGNCFVVTSLFRRSDFDRVGGFNPNMQNGLEDWDFWISVLENGGEAYRIDEILFYYRFKQGETRNHCIPETLRELHTNLVKNHAKLYWDNYQDLFDFSMTRVYKFALKMHKLHILISKWIKK